MDAFLRSSGVEPAFDLLVIDVEGFEEKAFNAFDLAFWRPGMMIVELNDYHADFVAPPALQLSAKRVRDKILGTGYMQVYADAINTIFFHNSRRSS